MAEKAGAHFDIEVDGGITPHNVKDVLDAGANVIVAGTSVFLGNMADNVAQFKKEFQDFRA
jgi:ribulose-phosphate 3-epimerase